MIETRFLFSAEPSIDIEETFAQALRHALEIYCALIIEYGADYVTNKI